MTINMNNKINNTFLKKVTNLIKYQKYYFVINNNKL